MFAENSIVVTDFLVTSSAAASTSYSSLDQPNEYTFFAHTRVRRYGTTQAPSATKRINYISHTVTPSDTLQGIALKYNCSVTTLARVNKLWSAESLHLKETIRVPIDDDSPISDNVRIQKAAASTRGKPMLASAVTPTGITTRNCGDRTSAATETAAPKESINDILSRVDSVIRDTSTSVRQIQKESTISHLDEPTGTYSPNRRHNSSSSLQAQQNSNSSDNSASNYQNDHGTFVANRDSYQMI